MCTPCYGELNPYSSYLTNPVAWTYRYSSNHHRNFALTEYRYPPFLRLIIAVCLPFSLLLAVISWLAYQIDGAMIGLYMLPVWALMSVFWAYTLATMPQWVRFEETQLAIGYWRRQYRLPYAEIHTVRWRPWGLLIGTTRAQVLLSRVHPNVVAAIHGELEQRVPVAQARYRHRFAEFPLSLRARRVAPIFSLLFGPLLIALALGSLNYLLTENDSSSTVSSLFMFVISTSWLILGLGLCYAVLCNYIWRYTFTADRIRARYSLHQREWPTRSIQSIGMVSEKSIYRGVTRIHWRIDIEFTDGEKLAVSPSQWGARLNNSDVQDKLLLRQLIERLHALYPLPQTVEVIPASMVESRD